MRATASHVGFTVGAATATLARNNSQVGSASQSLLIVFFSSQAWISSFHSASMDLTTNTVPGSTWTLRGVNFPQCDYLSCGIKLSVSPNGEPGEVLCHPSVLSNFWMLQASVGYLMALMCGSELLGGPWSPWYNSVSKMKGEG